MRLLCPKRKADPYGVQNYFMVSLSETGILHFKLFYGLSFFELFHFYFYFQLLHIFIQGTEAGIAQSV